MKKEDLIKLGLTEEQATKVLEANVEQLKDFVPYARFKEMVDERNAIKKELAERDVQLENLRKNNKENTELQETIKKLQEDNKNLTEKHNEELSKIKLDNALNSALTTAKAKNIKAVKSLLNLESIKLENDSLTGLDEQLKQLLTAEDSKFLFELNEDTTAKAKISGAEPSIGNKEGNATGKPLTYSEMLALGE